MEASADQMGDYKDGMSWGKGLEPYMHNLSIIGYKTPRTEP